TLFTEFRELYAQPTDIDKVDRDFPWSLPKEKINYASKVSKTLFGRNYLCVVIDEAHFCRNPGATHWAPLTLLNQCAARLVLTATPVQTRIEDVGAMGRLANIPHFSSQEFADEIADDIAVIRRARVDDPESVRSLQVQASRRMQSQFSGAMICRSAKSKDFFGKPLLSLPKKTVFHVNVQLQDWELKWVDQSLNKESFEQLALAKVQGIQTESLYSNERLMVTFPREDRKKPVPSIGSERQWKVLGEPTKVNTVKNIACHFLAGDDAPPPIVGEKGVTFPPYTPSAETTWDRKLLIYQDDLLVLQVLRVFGAPALALNGSLNYPARERVVKEFKESKEYRILIISKVGAVGLNLTCADTLIFLVRCVHLCASLSRTDFPFRISSGPTLTRTRRLVASIARVRLAQYLYTTFLLLVRSTTTCRYSRGVRL
ncbi:hypothetical protein FA13DRAFT_1628369, partial [Coprinellus micaceus]